MKRRRGNKIFTNYRGPPSAFSCGVLCAVLTSSDPVKRRWSYKLIVYCVQAQGLCTVKVMFSYSLTWICIRKVMMECIQVDLINKSSKDTLTLKWCLKIFSETVIFAKINIFSSLSWYFKYMIKNIDYNKIVRKSIDINLRYQNN